MKTFFVVLLVALAIAGANAQQPASYGESYDYKEQRLNQALNAAFAEVLRLGTYEQIFNEYLGYGNYVVPDYTDCKKAQWPPLHGKGDGNAIKETQYASLWQVLKTGIITVSGAPNGVFAVADGNGYIVDGAEYWLVVAMVERFSFHYGKPIALIFLDATYGDSDAVYDKTNDLVQSLYSDVPVNFAIGTTPQSVYLKRMVSQSCPYFYSNLGAVRSNLDPQTLVSTVWDMQISGVTTGVIEGTQAHLWALDALPEENIIVYPTYDLAVYGATGNGAHVFVADQWQLDLLVESCTDCNDLDIWITTENYVFFTAFLKSSATTAAISIAVAGLAIAAVFF